MLSCLFDAVDPFSRCSICILFPSELQIASLQLAFVILLSAVTLLDVDLLGWPWSNDSLYTRSPELSSIRRCYDDERGAGSSSVRLSSSKNVLHWSNIIGGCRSSRCPMLAMLL